MLDVSADLMAAYALRVGADFKILRQENRSDVKLPRPHAVKFYIPSELERYDSVLWIDADCLVSPAAPDLFETVPEDAAFAAWCDEGVAFWNSHMQRPVYAHGYFNSGVMLARTGAPFELALSYMTDRRAELSALEVTSIMGEQTPLNKAVHELGLPVHRLSEQWNFLLNPEQAAHLGVDTTMHSAFIVHCAGGMFTGAIDPKDRAQRAAGMRRLREGFGW